MKKYESIDALNWSSLKEIYISPRNFLWKHYFPKGDTVFFSLGRSVHMALLEPDKFENQYVKRPSEWDSWRTNASKEWKKEQIFQGKEILTEDDSRIIENIQVNFAVHPDCKVLEFTKKEQIIEWKDNGVKCKGRLDAVSNDRVIDIKTTNNLFDFVRRDFFRYMYHGQLAWYLDGAISAGFTSKKSDVYVIACETKPPFDVAIFEISDEILSVGRNLKNVLLNVWISCKTANIWPGIYPNLTVLNDVPPWAPGQNKYDDEI